MEGRALRDLLQKAGAVLSEKFGVAELCLPTMTVRQTPP